MLQVEPGTSVIELCRKLSISEQPIYTWRRNYAVLGNAGLRLLKQAS